MGKANIPVGMKSMGDWHVMFQQKDGMLMMWATQAPMEEFKQIVVKVERQKGVRRAQEVAGLPDVAFPSAAREFCPQGTIALSRRRQCQPDVGPELFFNPVAGRLGCLESQVQLNSLLTN